MSSKIILILHFFYIEGDTTMKKGFTLIELIITISVIGVLAAIALPRFTDVTKDAKVAQIQANKKNLETALAMYMVSEEKEADKLFWSVTQSHGSDPVIRENTVHEFAQKYLNKDIPELPGIHMNGVARWDEKPEDIEGDVFKYRRLGMVWAFTDRGEVYPLVEESEFGLRWDKF